MASSQFPGITLGDENESKIRAFDYDYSLGKELRSGSYGTVYITRHKITNEKYAVKVIDRTKLKAKDDANTIREINIMKDLKDLPNTVKLIDVYMDPETFYMVQVFAEGGDVFDRLAQRTAYTERDARQLSKTLLQTLNDMHALKICHRDLKPENLLLKGQWDDAAIMLADFGFAKYIPDEGLKTRCGTPAFVAPEIIKGQAYKQQVDMWSCGCLIYMIIGGYPPFRDETHRGLFRKIRAADFTFHKKYWSNVSIDAKQLITGLMTVDPKVRLTCKQALGTTWLEVDESQLSTRDLSGSISEIKSFDARRKLKSAMTAVFLTVASNFKHEKVSDLMKDMDSKDEHAGSVNLGSEDAESHKFRMSLTHKKTFAETYEIGGKVHAGSFAVVHECIHRSWGIAFAVKIVERDGKPETDEAVLHEVSIMNKLEHPNIVKVVDFFEEDDHYYVVMELLAGGDVFDRILAMKSYTENDARGLAKILLETVGYIHKTGVAHRDIKPQNLLLVVSMSSSFDCPVYYCDHLPCQSHLVV
jgi:serine/threonine protein kinase